MPKQYFGKYDKKTFDLYKKKYDDQITKEKFIDFLIDEKIVKKPHNPVNLELYGIENIIYKLGLHPTLITELANNFTKHIKEITNKEIEKEELYFNQEFAITTTPLETLNKFLQQYIPDTKTFIYSYFYKNNEIDINLLNIYIKKEFNQYQNYLFDHIQEYLTSYYDKKTMMTRIGFLSELKSLYVKLKMFTYIKKHLGPSNLQIIEMRKNPYPNIFIDYKAFKIFLDFFKHNQLISPINLNFIYQKMKDLKLIVPEITFALYKHWVLDTPNLFPSIKDFVSTPTITSLNDTNVKPKDIERIERFNLLYEKYYQ